MSSMGFPAWAQLETYRPTKMTRRYPRWVVGKPLLIGTSALAAFGDAMFGYAQGAIASAQVQPSFIKTLYGIDVTLQDVANGQVPVDTWLQAIVVSCLNLTALGAALVGARVCDVYGRRHSLRVGAICYLGASIGQIFAPNLAVFIFSRCLQGVGVGFLSMTVPIIQCEIAGDHARGKFVSIEYLCLNIGYALSAWVGYGFFFEMPKSISWRGPFIIQGALAIILITVSFFMPETPRWLIQNGFKEEGLQTLADLHAKGDAEDAHVLHTYVQIVETCQAEATLERANWTELWTKYPRQTLMGVTCQIFAQFAGINAILYYLPENLLRAGFDVPKSLLFAGISAICYCCGTIPTLFTVESGRKRILLWTSVALIIALSVVGGVQFWEASLPIGRDKRVAANTIFAFVCLYLFFFGWGWGPIPWLLPAEIYPMRARARGMALSTCANWLSNFAVAFATPYAFRGLGGGYYFVIVGCIIIAFFTVYFFYKETANFTLEEIEEVFNKKRSGLVGGVDAESGYDARANYNAEVRALHQRTESEKAAEKMKNLEVDERRGSAGSVLSGETVASGSGSDGTLDDGAQSFPGIEISKPRSDPPYVEQAEED